MSRSAGVRGSDGAGGNESTGAGREAGLDHAGCERCRGGALGKLQAEALNRRHMSMCLAVDSRKKTDS